ncbi:PI-PLC domain-containing protein [Geotalea uraniireducens]|uniref:GP-PDE domain-containing protein n=1 Tax=Geotalea uraniireducens (strain Rf4) TaxID=351605 RepID=A5G6C2_GEOUR|nr:hypothetical protein [Geotalea uraniireducens]ABQ27340.1 hypothetical protein Gura_3179 [Geotalea uraniireducens Rf4]
MRSYLTRLLIVIQFVIIIFGLLQNENRAFLKQLFLRSDAVLFNGSLYRLYLHQQKPRDSMLVASHAVDDYSWLGAEPFLVIAHGLGPKLYGGDNTIKTLVKGRERGFRVYEVDISLTADNVLVCYHGGDETEINAMRYADYLAVCRSKGQDPCRFDDIVSYARKNPAVSFVLDVKNRFYDAYGMIRNAVGDQNLGKSFIPQVYDFEQLPFIRKDGLFAGEIFTSYRSALTNRQIFDYSKKYDVKVITLTLQRFVEQKGDFPRDLVILTHPVNDPFIAADVKKLGARGIYTSYITHRSIPELFTSALFFTPLKQV